MGLPGAERLGLTVGTTQGTGAIFANGLTAPADGTVRVTICLASSVVARVIIEGNALTLNAGTALTADAMYSFEFGIDRNRVFNMSLASSAVVRYLLVQFYRER